MTLEVWIGVMLAGITLLVTLLGLMLALFAIAIGVATFWGMAGVKEEAHRVATDAANKKLAEYFEQQSLKDKIRTMVSDVAPAAPNPYGREQIYVEGVDENANNDARQGE